MRIKNTHENLQVEFFINEKFLEDDLLNVIIIVINQIMTMLQNIKQPERNTNVNSNTY